MKLSAVVNLYIDIKYFIIGLYNNRRIILELTKRDYQKLYKDKYLGVLWNYIQPLIFATILWFLFTIGFRGDRGMKDVPFFIYLFTGINAWHYFSQNLSSMTGVINSYSYLLEQPDFSMGMVPVARLLGAVIPHAIFMGLTFIFAAIEGFYPGLYTIQLLYYLFGMYLLILGMGWIFASTTLFVEDIKNLVQLIVQFGFWLTPIFWVLDSKVPEPYIYFFKLNPMVYILQGYRDSVYAGNWFWQYPWETLYFWLFTITMLVVGSVVFRRLRPHFAELA